jgi:hypothetical protein
VTPATDIKLGPKERLQWVPVDSKSFVPGMVNPGDLITFIVPTRASSSPTPAGSIAEVRSGDVPLDSHELIGPFKVGSLGNRLSSKEIHDANRLSTDNERIVGIIVEADGDRLHADAMKLLDRLEKSGYRNIGVLLHPRP